jgi:hypothetical protein
MSVQDRPLTSSNHRRHLPRAFWPALALAVWFTGWAAVGVAGERAKVVEARRESARRASLALAAGVSASDPGANPRPALLPEDAAEAYSPSGPQWLLPDLQTLLPTDLRIHDPGGGRRTLRLSNTIWNGGRAPLEVTGVLDPSTRHTQVHQRVYVSGGATVDHLVGDFLWHPGHQHWHIEDFAIYQLWSVTPRGDPDQVVATSEKLSYCLIDTDRIDPDLPGYDAARDYRGCGRSRQGISLGWGDEYRSYLPGQSLDITGLADGIYVLISTVNPTRQLLEQDYGNNTAVRFLRLEGSTVVVLPSLHRDRLVCERDGRC